MDRWKNYFAAWIFTIQAAYIMVRWSVAVKECSLFLFYCSELHCSNARKNVWSFRVIDIITLHYCLMVGNSNCIVSTSCVGKQLKGQWRFSTSREIKGTEACIWMAKFPFKRALAALSIVLNLIYTKKKFILLVNKHWSALKKKRSHTEKEHH